jgi:tripartite-type tricarboxylate transporter receptor subunit TctC
MNTSRRTLLAAAAALAASGSPWAQGFPARPVRLVVPLAPGGATDIAARVLAERIGAHLGQPMIVENRGGAGGTVGSQAVATAAPDGHTLLMGTVGTLAVSPSMYRRLPYDSDRDLVPVSRVAVGNFALVATPALPAATVQDFLRLARSRPGELNYGSAGNGSMLHLGMELLNRAAGIEVKHIPYKSSGQLVTALAGGEFQVGLPDVPSVLQLARAGRLKVLAVAGSARDPLLPEVPTLVESGLAGVEVASWLGVMAPARTPAAVIDQLNAAIVKTMGDPAVATRLAELGMRAITSSPAEFREFLARERPKWDAVVKAAGVVAD